MFIFSLSLLLLLLFSNFIFFFTNFNMVSKPHFSGLNNLVTRPCITKSFFSGRLSYFWGPYCKFYLFKISIKNFSYAQSSLTDDSAQIQPNRWVKSGSRLQVMRVKISRYSYGAMGSATLLIRKRKAASIGGHRLGSWTIEFATSVFHSFLPSKLYPLVHV